MISVYSLKPKFQQLLTPVLELLHRRQITANTITLAAIAWSVILALLLFLSPQHPVCLLAVAFGLLIRMALNALDGMMARTYKQQSKLGEILNELGDVVSDTVIFCGLFAFPFSNKAVIVLFIVLSIINEFAGVLAKVISGERRYDGPMGKSDRALVVGLWCIIYFIFPAVSAGFNGMMAIAILLLLLGAYKRLSNALN